MVGFGDEYSPEQAVSRRSGSGGLANLSLQCRAKDIGLQVLEGSWFSRLLRLKRPIPNSKRPTRENIVCRGFSLLRLWNKEKEYDHLKVRKVG